MSVCARVCVLKVQSSFPSYPVRSPRLTGNQVTPMLSLQMLSENMLVYQEAVRSPFKIELWFVCLSTAYRALCQVLSLSLFSTFWLVRVLHEGGWGLAMLPCHTSWVGGRKYVWLKLGRYRNFFSLLLTRGCFQITFCLSILRLWSNE